MAWAADTTVRSGSKDEFRVPRTQSHKATVKLQLGRAGGSCQVSSEATSAVDPGRRGVNNGVGASSLVQKVAESQALIPWEQETKENLERHSGAAEWS